jgi:transmembrane sensor
MSRLEKLWESWLTDALTPEEVSEFQGLVTQADPEAIALLDDMLQSGAYQGMAHSEKEELIFKRILLLTRQRSRTIPLFPRIAAAAAILLMLGTGGYFLFFNKPPQTAHTPVRPFTNDLAPGGNKAILTLANGSTILLDSAANGTLARQGNAQIQKLANGQIAYHSLHDQSPELIYNTLTTPRGGQYQLILPDGTKVWLNAASSIRYPTAFTGKTREVTVTGEAYFEVAHKERQLFRVKAGNTLIEDLGTHFNINAYTDEPFFKTTLLEGAVKVSGLILQPGEQVAISSNGKITLFKGVDVDGVVAWKDGKFRYNSVDIGSIMRQAARWYDLDVQYEGKIDETFSGGISRNVNASELLHILEITKKVHFDIEGKKIIVKPINAK